MHLFLCSIDQVRIVAWSCSLGQSETKELIEHTTTTSIIGTAKFVLDLDLVRPLPCCVITFNAGLSITCPFLLQRCALAYQDYAFIGLDGRNAQIIIHTFIARPIRLCTYFCHTRRTWRPGLHSVMHACTLLLWHASCMEKTKSSQRPRIARTASLTSSACMSTTHTLIPMRQSGRCLALSDSLTLRGSDCINHACRHFHSQNGTSSPAQIIMDCMTIARGLQQFKLCTISR